MNSRDFKLIHGDCLERMKNIPNSSIDLVVTSPPYDNLRTYNDSLKWDFDIFQGIAEHLYRVVKVGGVVVWIVGDSTVNGSETGTSFRQALHFKDIGFNLHDTMIYRKKHFAPYSPICHRYYQEFEYMFVFSKGKPLTCNYIKEPCKHAGGRAGGYSRRPDGRIRIDRKGKNKELRIKETKIRANIWQYSNAKKSEHPASFPEKLAHDHIVSWSNPGDTVMDPLMGSGTTGIACARTKRKFIGIEKDLEYFNIAKNRISRWLK